MTASCDVESLASNRTTSKMVMEAVGSQKGKTFLITGGYGGIGAITTKDLLEAGATVVLACRSEKKMQEFKASLERDLAKRLECLVCDVSDLDSVKDCAEQYLRAHKTLDVLICNSGIMFGPARKSKQGHELQFATNTLGHFLLTELLLESLERSSQGGRVVHVSSVAYKLFGDSKFDVEAYANGLDDVAKANYSPYRAYQQSKQASVEATRETAKRYPSLTAVSLHPGIMIGTDLMRDTSMFGFMKFALFNGALGGLVCEKRKSNEQGAATTTFCATVSNLDNGGYYNNCASEPVAPHACDDDNNSETFELLMKLTEKWR